MADTFESGVRNLRIANLTPENGVRTITEHRDYNHAAYVWELAHSDPFV